MTGCPYCQADLKKQRLPIGVDILCPSCKRFFKVSDTQPTANLSPLGSRLRTGRAASSGRLTIVLGSGIVFLVVGVMLIIWCFRGNPQPTSMSTADEGWKIQAAPKKFVPSKPLNALTAVEQKSVDRMVRRGLAYLRKSQQVDGTWSAGEWSSGAAALGGLTFLECGVAADDPAVSQAAAAVRGAPVSRTYLASTHLLFLNRLDVPQDKDRIKKLALQLVAGQTRQFGWDYACPPLEPDEEEELYRLLMNIGSSRVGDYQAKQRRKIDGLPPRLRNLALFAAAVPKVPEYYKGGGDNSNTQFALLALLAARRHHLPVDHALRQVVERFRGSQESDGHWQYSEAIPQPYPGASMTCAGLLALAAGYSLDVPIDLPAATPLEDSVVRRGLTHLSEHIAVNDLTGRPSLPNVYFLWSVERVGVLFRQSKLGGKDWYRWGLGLLESCQNNDGSFAFPPGGKHGFSADIDVCFALLFLRQINLAQELTDKLEELLDRVEPVKDALPGSP